MCMYDERLQILVSRDQRRRLREEARRSGASVASLIREAIDQRFGGAPTTQERIDAARRISSRSAKLPAPAELKELIAGRFDDPDAGRETTG